MSALPNMEHPLRSVPVEHRKRFFFAFLFLTLALFAVFQILDRPLRTQAAPNGIVSFELAGTPLTARAITDSWKQLSLLLSATGQANPDIVNVAYALAAFSLGLDYLFMPAYALALAFGTLLVAQKHSGWFKSLAVLAGYAAFAAAAFDAVENYALLQVLLGKIDSGYPAIAAFCAILKFGLLAFGVLSVLTGWLAPRRAD